MNRILINKAVQLICFLGIFLITESCQLDKFEEKRNALEKSAKGANEDASAFIEEMQEETQIEAEIEIGKDLLKDLPISVQKILLEKSFAEKYELSNWINPNFQKVDFEGDGIPEYAVLIINRINKKKGYVIVENGNYIIHGAGVEFGAGGNNFDWLGYWAIIREEILEETIVKEGEIIGVREVENPSEALLIKELEGAGGYIIKESNYKWLQIE